MATHLLTIYNELLHLRAIHQTILEGIFAKSYDGMSFKSLVSQELNNTFFLAEQMAPREFNTNEEHRVWGRNDVNVHHSAINYPWRLGMNYDEPSIERHANQLKSGGLQQNCQDGKRTNTAIHPRLKSVWFFCARFACWIHLTAQARRGWQNKAPRGW